MKNFKTVNKIANAEIIEKKSKFIANVSPVETEEQAINFINQIKKQHYNAKHNCFAYVISGQIPIIRFSDDKEPSGTAGKPILDVILGEKLENIVVVVTRYFGGILLGTGGLVRAYGKSAKEGILAAQIIEMDLYSNVSIICDYSISSKIQYELETNSYIINDIEYTDKVTFKVYIKETQKEIFQKNIVNISNNNAKIFIGENIYLKLLNGKVFE